MNSGIGEMAGYPVATMYEGSAPMPDDCTDDSGDRSPVGGRSTQWATTDDKIYQPVGRSETNLPPGAYNIINHQGSIYFGKFDIRVDDLLQLPGTVLGEVVSEIGNFWDLYDHYKSYGIAHRRGILIGGPAGSGKSCTLKLVAADVIKRGGIVIPYENPNILLEGMKRFREIQPDTPVVILMEDLESILNSSRSGQSAVLNLLDGVMSDAWDRVVFMATTNYFEHLERRITNRPSRFDRVFTIENPTKEARLQYLQYLFRGKSVPDGFVLDKVASDTEKLSFAHLKELVTAVAIMKNPYKKVLEALHQMAQDTLPTGDEMEYGPNRGPMGFNGFRKARSARHEG